MHTFLLVDISARGKYIICSPEGGQRYGKEKRRYKSKSSINRWIQAKIYRSLHESTGGKGKERTADTTSRCKNCPEMQLVKEYRNEGCVMSSRDWTGNVKSIFVCNGVNNHTDEERQADDYYATEPKAVKLLLERESFNADIWVKGFDGKPVIEWI